MSLFADFDNTYAKLPDRFFVRLDPTPVAKPSLLKLNDRLAADLGLDPKFLSSPKGLAVLAGNSVPQGAQPLAMAYAGQQFGNWVPQLGDGRALLLGEVSNTAGERHDIQLKGSGPTPFSRMGDGRAWLGPVLREYIVSEFMAAFGVPSTRALAAVATGEPVIREQVLPGAILTRVARSHLRVGTFQYFAARGDEEGLRTLADYAISRLYPACADEPDRYAALLTKVLRAQAALIARWMGLGFIHGVMNTDNVSIAGETIDYGPCAFMDGFDPNRVFSSIDEMGRYSYGNQPRIGHWNLVQFAQALLPLLGDTKEQAVQRAQQIIDMFPAVYEEEWRTVYAAKLGLEKWAEGDELLFNDLLAEMAKTQVDFTLAFRTLSDPGLADFLDLFDDKTAVESWIRRWRNRLSQKPLDDDVRSARMRAANPAFIPRNHRIEQAIHAALEHDLEPFGRLTRVLERPCIDQPGDADLMDAPMATERVHHTFCGT